MDLPSSIPENTPPIVVKQPKERNAKRTRITNLIKERAEKKMALALEQNPPPVVNIPVIPSIFTSAPQPSLTPVDPRANFSRHFLEALNTCDIEIFAEWMRKHCTQDVMCSFLYVGELEHNPLGPNSRVFIGLETIIEVYGFWFKAAPDNVYLMTGHNFTHDSATDILTSSTAYTCQYTKMIDYEQIVSDEELQRVEELRVRLLMKSGGADVSTAPSVPVGTTNTINTTNTNANSKSNNTNKKTQIMQPPAAQSSNNFNSNKFRASDLKTLSTLTKNVDDVSKWRGSSRASSVCGGFEQLAMPSHNTQNHNQNDDNIYSNPEIDSFLDSIELDNTMDDHSLLYFDHNDLITVDNNLDTSGMQSSQCSLDVVKVESQLSQQLSNHDDKLQYFDTQQSQQNEPELTTNIFNYENLQQLPNNTHINNTYLYNTNNTSSSHTSSNTPSISTATNFTSSVATTREAIEEVLSHAVMSKNIVTYTYVGVYKCDVSGGGENKVNKMSFEFSVHQNK